MNKNKIQNQKANQPSAKPFRVLAARKDLTNEQWLELRTHYLNISEVSAALNLSPFKTAMSLWASKTGIYNEPFSDNRFCEWGRIMEPVLRDYYGKQNNCKMQEVPYILQSVEYPFICGNVDAVATFPDGSKKIIEIKTTSSINQADWGEDSCPSYYYTQIMLYEWLTGVHNGCLVCLIGGNDYRVVEVPYNEAVVQAILIQCKEFWKHVTTRQPLPPVEKDNSLLSKLYPQSKPNSVALANEFIAKLDKLEELKNQEKEIKAAKDVIEAELKQALEENELATAGEYKVSWKTAARSTFSADKAKELLTEEQIQSCMVSSSTRTLRISKVKPKAKK